MIMTTADRQDRQKTIIISAVVLSAALLTGFLFAGWLHYSDTIFMTMLMDGISWCF
jgi:hypothetical protein